VSNDLELGRIVFGPPKSGHFAASGEIIALKELLSASTRWEKGSPPLNRIVLLWNGKMIFGPMGFNTEKEKLDVAHLSPTHYMIIPKAP
jgi:hypothetical protein